MEDALSQASAIQLVQASGRPMVAGGARQSKGRRRVLGETFVPVSGTPPTLPGLTIALSVLRVIAHLGKRRSGAWILVPGRAGSRQCSPCAVNRRCLLSWWGESKGRLIPSERLPRSFPVRGTSRRRWKVFRGRCVVFRLRTSMTARSLETQPSPPAAGGSATFLLDFAARFCYFGPRRNRSLSQGRGFFV